MDKLQSQHVDNLYDNKHNNSLNQCLLYSLLFCHSVSFCDKNIKYKVLSILDIKLAYYGDTASENHHTHAYTHRCHMIFLVLQCLKSNLVGFVLLDLQIYVYVLQIVVCPFVLFSFWPLCCLFFFDIRILITPLVSSNSY